jgi:hypothetical protein
MERIADEEMRGFTASEIVATVLIIRSRGYRGEEHYNMSHGIFR